MQVVFQALHMYHEKWQEQMWIQYHVLDYLLIHISSSHTIAIQRRTWFESVRSHKLVQEYTESDLLTWLRGNKFHNIFWSSVTSSGQFDKLQELWCKEGFLNVENTKKSNEIK